MKIESEPKLCKPIDDIKFEEGQIAIVCVDGTRYVFSHDELKGSAFNQFKSAEPGTTGQVVMNERTGKLNFKMRKAFFQLLDNKRFQLIMYPDTVKPK